MATSRPTTAWEDQSSENTSLSYEEAENTTQSLRNVENALGDNEKTVPNVEER